MTEQAAGKPDPLYLEPIGSKEGQGEVYRRYGRGTWFYARDLEAFAHGWAHLTATGWEELNCHCACRLEGQLEAQTVRAAA